MVNGLAISLTLTLLAIQALDAGLDGSSKRQYCGRDLIITMRWVCGGYYKRSDTSLSDNTDIEPPMDISEMLFPMMQERKRALTLVRRSVPRNKRWGIVDECCHNSCSLDELKGYCGKPSD